MAGKSLVRASGDQRIALKALAKGADRGKADRARAGLLTLAGWTSARIAEAFGVREDTRAAMAPQFHAWRDRRLEGEYFSGANSSQG